MYYIYSVAKVLLQNNGYCIFSCAAVPVLAAAATGRGVNVGGDVYTCTTMCNTRSTLYRNNLIYYVDQLINRVEKRDFDGRETGDEYTIAEEKDELKPQLYDITIYDVRINSGFPKFFSSKQMS